MVPVTRAVGLAASSLLLLMISCTEAVDPETPMQNNMPAAIDPAAVAFRNAVTEPPPGWTGHVFNLSHDYPTQQPAP